MRLKYYLFPKSDIEMIIADDFQYKDSNTNRSDLSLFLRNKTWYKLSFIRKTNNINSQISLRGDEFIDAGAYACGHVGPCVRQRGKCCKPGVFYCSNNCGCGGRAASKSSAGSRRAPRGSPRCWRARAPTSSARARSSARPCRTRRA